MLHVVGDCAMFVQVLLAQVNFSASTPETNPPLGKHNNK